MSAEHYQQREGVLVRLIEALGRIERSEDWSTLTSEVFDGVLESLEGRLSAEANKPLVDLPAIYRLQGQIQWAKKYADLAVLTNSYRLELQGIRKQLNPGTEPFNAPDTVIKL